MTALHGTASLMRLIIRRDRIRIGVWIVAIVGLTYLTVGSIQSHVPHRTITG